jgi:hypothetical protein
MKIFLIALVVMTTQTTFAVCISQHSIRNFNVVDETTIELDAGKKDYSMRVAYCSELPWAHKIGFENFGFSQVCEGDTLLVMDNFSNGIKQRCHIYNIDEIK